MGLLIEKISQTWEIKILQEAVNIWKQLENNQLTFEDLDNYLKQIKLHENARRISNERTTRLAGERPKKLPCGGCGKEPLYGH
jgi:hypothetical protein